MGKKAGRTRFRRRLKLDVFVFPPRPLPRLIPSRLFPPPATGRAPVRCGCLVDLLLRIPPRLGFKLLFLPVKSWGYFGNILHFPGKRTETAVGFPGPASSSHPLLGFFHPLGAVLLFRPTDHGQSEQKNERSHSRILVQPSARFLQKIQPVLNPLPQPVNRFLRLASF